MDAQSFHKKVIHTFDYLHENPELSWKEINTTKYIKKILEDQQPEKLEDLRQTIDQIDQQIVKLLEKRMDTVTKIGETKQASKKAVYDEKREQEVLEKIASRLENTKYKETITATYIDLMKHSRDYQNELNGEKVDD